MKYLSFVIVALTTAIATGQGSGWPDFEFSTAPQTAPPAPVLEQAVADPPSIYSEDLPPTAVHGPQFREDVPSVNDIWDATFGSGMAEFRGYRHESASTAWIAGNGDQFGMLSFIFGTAFHRRGIADGFSTGFQWHLLSGPDHVDVPPRVYDFLLGYQDRDLIGRFGYDVSAMVAASSDFEGSARKGIRFPSHAVGFLGLTSTTELVFGVDYIDRADVQILPVGGVILRPNNSLRLQLVFPQPRVDLALNSTNRLYLSGELGGGQWAIRREISLLNDLFTYSDLRLAIGLESTEATKVSGVELAWLFNRKIEFQAGPGNADLADTVMLRFVHSQ